MNTFLISSSWELVSQKKKYAVFYSTQIDTIHLKVVLLMEPIVNLWKQNLFNDQGPFGFLLYNQACKRCQLILLKWNNSVIYPTLGNIFSEQKEHSSIQLNLTNKYRISSINLTSIIRFSDWAVHKYSLIIVKKTNGISRADLE